MLIKVLQNNVNNDELNKLINNNIIFVAAFKKTCTYCINMKSEWNNFKKMILANYSNLQGIILEIDSSAVSSITNPLIANNVNGFPSLFIVKNNKIIPYNDERTTYNFMKFLKLHIPKTNISKSKIKSIRTRRRKSTRTRKSTTTQKLS